MKARLGGALVGVVFGMTLCWSGMSNPDVIRGALLLRHSYLFLVFGSGVLVAALGTELLRRRAPRALLADTPVAYSREQPARRHIVGSLMFGVGWAVADACPGPIATQIGQGIPWSAFVLVGLLTGVLVFLRRARVGETEPAVDRVPSPAPSRIEDPRPALVS